MQGRSCALRWVSTASGTVRAGDQPAAQGFWRGGFRVACFFLTLENEISPQVAPLCFLGTGPRAEAPGGEEVRAQRPCGPLSCGHNPAVPGPGLWLPHCCQLAPLGPAPLLRRTSDSSAGAGPRGAH